MTGAGTAAFADGDASFEALFATIRVLVVRHYDASPRLAGILTLRPPPALRPNVITASTTASTVVAPAALLEEARLSRS